MGFHGSLKTEERTSDSGSKYLVKVAPEKEGEAKNKAAEAPALVTSNTAKGENAPKAK